MIYIYTHHDIIYTSYIYTHHIYIFHEYVYIISTHIIYVYHISCIYIYTYILYHLCISGIYHLYMYIDTHHECILYNIYIYIYVLFFSNLPHFPFSSVLSLRRGVFQWGVQRRNHCSSGQSSKGRTDQFSRGVDVPRFFQKWLCGAEVWWLILMGAWKIQKYEFPSSWLVLWEENHLVDEPRNFGLIISDWGRLATYSSKTMWAHRSHHSVGRNKNEISQLSHGPTFDGTLGMPRPPFALNETTCS